MKLTFLTSSFLLAAALPLCASADMSLGDSTSSSGVKDPPDTSGAGNNEEGKKVPSGSESWNLKVDAAHRPINVLKLAKSKFNSVRKFCVPPVRVNCLEDMNPYREAAGLKAFQNAEILPLPKSEGKSSSGDDVSASSKFLSAVCGSRQSTRTATENPAPQETAATYAVHTQSGNTASCSAAVDYWKGAIENFDSLPPKHDDETDLYDDRRNVSFVALFNPQDNPSVDCAYITCPRETDNESSTDEREPVADEGPSTVVPGESRPMRSQSAESEKTNSSKNASGATPAEQTHVLVCVTQPVALKDDLQPFTEDQFKKITDSLSNSSSIAIPAAVAISAVSLGMIAA